MNATVIRRDGLKGRFYEVDGVLFPSVTHILTAINKPALVPWAANQERAHVVAAATSLYRETAAQPLLTHRFRAALEGRLGVIKAHQRTMEAAGDIGTQAHRAIEWLLRTALGVEAGPEPMVSAPALVAVQAFQTWAVGVALKPILVERIVYSKRHEYAGTLDLLARVNGVLTTIDWKTGKAVYAESHLQAAAYSAALAEMGYLEPTQSLIVRLPKVAGDPGFDVVPVEGRAELLPVFLATRVLWAWQWQQATTWRPKKARVA
jgi:hypothetical protein